MNQQQASVDKIIIGVSALVLIVSVFLQFDSSFFDNGSGNANTKPIGKVTQSLNDVRRKPTSGVYWKNAKLEDQVYEGDSFFTGSGSETQIELGNGDKLKLDEQTLVIMHEGANGLELDLAYGGVSGKLSEGANLTIHENGTNQVFKSHDSEVRVTKSRTHKAQVRVVSGKVELQGEAPKIIAQNEEVEVAPQGPVEVKRVQQIRLVEPVDNKTLYGHTGVEIPMVWEAEGQNLSYQFEAANNNLFTKGKTAQKASAQNTMFALPGPGTYYWRVKVFEGSAHEPLVTSAINKFSVYSDGPPEVVFPKVDNLFVLDRVKEETKRIGFSWKVAVPEENFQTQISDKPDFSQILFEQKVTEKRLVTSNMDKNGEFYFRVKGEHTDWSESRHFYIDFRNNSASPPVEASYTYILPFKKSEKTATNLKLYHRGIKVDDFKAMSWEPNVAARGYQLEISQAADFGKSVSQKFDSQTSFMMPVLKPGPLFWRVKPIYRDAKASTISSADHWLVKLPPPVTQPAKLAPESAESAFDPKKDRDATLAWSPLMFASAYELQVANDTSFKNSKNTFPTVPTKKFAAEKGQKYYWRVRAIGAHGEPLGDFSSVADLTTPKAEERKIAAIPPPLPVGPKLIEPANDTSVITLGNPDAFLSLKWAKAKTSSGYEVEIATDLAFQSKVVETSSKLNNFVMKQSSLAKGTYYWHVRAHADNGTTAWSEPFNFTLK